MKNSFSFHKVHFTKGVYIHMQHTFTESDQLLRQYFDHGSAIWFDMVKCDEIHFSQTESENEN